MKRIRWAFAALTAAALLALTVGPATAAVMVTQTLGRNAVVYSSYPNDPTPLARWTASAQGELVDTNGNGIPDSLRARGAAAEDFGIIRARIARVQLQALIGGVWTNVQVNETDAVSEASPAYAVSYTNPGRFCATDPSLTRTYRVVNPHAVRRVDSVIASRTTISHNFIQRALGVDPGCPETPPPPPPVQADVQVAKTASVTQVPGTSDTTFAYTITARNLDTVDPAANVVVTDALPSEVVLVSPPPAGCTDTDPDTGTTLRCTLGTLDPGETDSVTFNVEAGASRINDDVIRNVANLTSSTADPATANNSSAVNVLIRPLVDLTVTKTAVDVGDSDPGIQPDGDTFEYRVLVRNTGPNQAVNVRVTDTWPSDVTFVSASGGTTGFTCAPSTDPAPPATVTCTGNLGSGTSVELVLTGTTADAGTQFTNQVAVTSDTYEQDTSDNSDTLVVTTAAG